jgi:hypothetical protein
MNISGGYTLRLEAELQELLDLLGDGTVSPKAARVFFAAMEAQAIRNAAMQQRSEPKTKRLTPTKPEFPKRELAERSGLSSRAVNAALFELRESNLLDWSMEALNFPSGKGRGRKLPLPRRFVRFLAACETRSTLVVLLCCLLRAMRINRDGVVKTTGTAKASCIARETGLSLRSVKSARATLIAQGLITPDATEQQRKLNRVGAFFRIRTEWGASKVAEKIVVPVRQTAPLPAKTCTQSAPPKRDKEPSKESRNQKPPACRIPAGVFKKNWERKEEAPTLRDVKPRDLQSLNRVESLFMQGCNAGIATFAPMDYLNWVAASVRAKQAPKGDPVKIFLGIVRNKMWGNITQAEEDAARKAIRKYRGDGGMSSTRFARSHAGLSAPSASPTPSKTLAYAPLVVYHQPKAPCGLESSSGANAPLTSSRSAASPTRTRLPVAERVREPHA